MPALRRLWYFPRLWGYFLSPSREYNIALPFFIPMACSRVSESA